MAQRVRLPKIALVPLAAGLVLGIATVVAMHIHAHARQARLRQQAEATLGAIADAQAGAVVAWREALLAEATELLEDVPLARRVQRFLSDPGDEQARADLAGRLASLATRRGYRGVFLLDLQGALLMGGAEGNEPVGGPARELAAGAMRGHQVAMSDLYRQSQTGEPRLDLAVPILDPDARQGAPLGALVLRLDPRPALSERLKAPPGTWSSLQGTLFRREEGGLRALTEVPGAPGDALGSLWPLDDGRLPAALVASQAGGVVEGRGLDGAPALATLRLIPASPWCLVVQVRLDEVLAPLADCTWPALADMALIALALAATLAEFGAVAREAAARQREREKHQAEEESLRKAAAEAEKLAEERRRRIAELEEELKRLREAGEKLQGEHAIDLAILASIQEPVAVVDPGGRIERLNWACERLTGYTCDELRGKLLWATLVHPRARQAAQKLFAKILASKSPTRHKSTWVTRSGDKLPCEWVVTTVSDAQGNPKFVVYVRA